MKYLAYLSALLLGTLAHGAKEPIRLQILLPDGSPAKKARVELRSADISKRFEHPSLPLTVEEVRADGEGRLQIEHLPGCVLVDVRGCALGLYNFFPEGGVLRLVPDEPLTGLVQDPGGHPVAGAAVHLRYFGSGTYTHVFHPLLRGVEGLSATSDQRGRFTIRKLRLNDYDFNVGGELVAKATVNAAPMVGTAAVWYSQEAEPPRIVVRPYGRVSGVVRNALTGTPMAGLPIEANLASWAEAHPQPTTETDAEGGFTFTSLPAHGQRNFRIGKAHLFERGEKPYPSDIVGLEIPLYPRHERPVQLVDRVTGQPPLVQANVAFRQEVTLPDGWQLRQDASRRINPKAHGAMVVMEMPTGPVALTAQARVPGGREVYRTITRDLELDDGSEPVTIDFVRNPGLLFHTRLPGDPPIGDPLWQTLSIYAGTGPQLRPIRYSSFPQWFVPTKGWGDALTIRVEQKFSDGSTLTLVEEKTFAADSDAWPVEIDLTKLLRTETP